MLVADLMQKDVRSIAPDASVGELVRALADSRVSGLPVVGTSGRVMGVVSATDVLQASAEKDDGVAQARLFDDTMVKEIMTPDAHVIKPEADVREAAKYMLYTEVRRLFVEDHGRLVGVISQTDIAHALGSGRI
jgi:CBS domain-containing protein